MVFARENAREFKNAPMAKLQAVFGDRLFGDACATPTDTEALHVVGACGMEFYAPVSDYILNTPELFCYIASFGAAKTANVETPDAAVPAPPSESETKPASAVPNEINQALKKLMEKNT